MRLALLAVAAALVLAGTTRAARLHRSSPPRTAVALRAAGPGIGERAGAPAVSAPVATRVVIAAHGAAPAPALPALPIAAPAACAVPRFDSAGAEPRTAKAVDAALGARGLAARGRAWLGKLGSVGGGARDTLIWTPDALDAARPIEVVVYFEGFGSFAAGAMDHRHGAAIERVAAVANAVYVAPDAPSSSHGDPTSPRPYWQAGCAARRCPGGHAAPGDFVAFVRELQARVAVQTCTASGPLMLRLHLIGFSNGGKGVVAALAQLAAVDFAIDDGRIAIGEVVFADGNYGGAWLAEAWGRIAARPEAPRLTILVGDGSFTGAAAAGGNRRRAATFWRQAAPGARAPAPGRTVEAPRLRLVPVPRSHHGIGDAAIDHLAIVAAQ